MKQLRNNYLFRYVSDISIIKINKFNNYLPLNMAPSVNIRVYDTT